MSYFAEFSIPSLQVCIISLRPKISLFDIKNTIFSKIRLNTKSLILPPSSDKSDENVVITDIHVQRVINSTGNMIIRLEIFCSMHVVALSNIDGSEVRVIFADTPRSEGFKHLISLLSHFLSVCDLSVELHKVLCSLNR